MIFNRKSPAGFVERALTGVGYGFDRTNKSGWSVFTRTGSPDVPVNPRIAERDARHLVVRIEKSHGVAQSTNKRNPEAIRERRAAERARIQAAMDRLDAERAELIRRRELLPSGDFDLMSLSERLRLEREIARIERERREWVQLMRQESA
ncbi:hypothetical protein FK530_22825 [Tsukamurella conjunctivitidis]|uniref:Uncharacterized protein n=1 Tax=Tsukamurella conjunctivitidis TaxID=2592068 RepID=A0A5C5RR91_9ACTN|nr:hypothetical protein [Tsukamurella conjunctivitidis]TWS25557.1 hypothetical protein FK530_22825 [Tsukamurella conjunctivitidis]